MIEYIFLVMKVYLFLVIFNSDTLGVSRNQIKQVYITPEFFSLGCVCTLYRCYWRFSVPNLSRLSSVTDFTLKIAWDLP